jgi:hypothetical protein
VSFYTLIFKIMAFIQYIRSILLGLLLSIFIFVGAVFYQLGAPTKGNIEFDAIYTSKTQIANSIQSPKIAIIAGSNALYGISCKTIHEQTQWPCFNGGTGAGLGIDYILYRARSWLKSGDIVLLPLEYELYRDKGQPNEQLINYIFARDPNYFLAADLVTKIRLMGAISLNRLRDGIVTKLKSIESKKSNYLMSYQDINEYGDVANNNENELTVEAIKHFKDFFKDDLERRLKIYELESNKFWLFNLDSKQPGLNSVYKFITWCQNNNIKVIATWPNTLKLVVYQGGKKQKIFQDIEIFYRRINVPIIGKPEDFMYDDKSMFFDTIYHLNDKGVRYRTQQLIPLLRPYLNQQSVVEIQPKR